MSLGMAGKNLKSSWTELLTAWYPCLGCRLGHLSTFKMDTCVWYGKDAETGNDEEEVGFWVPGFGFCLGEIVQLAMGLYCVSFYKINEHK